MGCCQVPVGPRAAVANATPSGSGCHRREGGKSDAIWFDACASWIGTSKPVIQADGEARRRVRLRRFGISRSAVTNQQFAAFVEATGYRTDAERFGWSYVFTAFVPRGNRGVAPEGIPWWSATDNAFWAAPEGPGSSVRGRQDHPVVHISWNDASAFATWCGGRLPTEGEWEHAARGGLDERRFPWGDDEPTDDRIHCNIWQGRFPDRNTAVDGFPGTAPVDAFPPSPAGLYNCSGNVWEWCQDPFRVRSQSRDGRTRDAEAVREKERTLKGGSYLCHRSHCYRYRIASRSGRHPDTAAGHTGFRIAFDDHAVE